MRIFNQNRKIFSIYKATTGLSETINVGSLTGVVPAHLISKDEQIILAIKPSMWFILFNSAKLIIFLLVVLLFTHLFRSNLSYYWYQKILQISAILFLVQLIASFLQWLSRLYILTDRRVLRIRGVFNIDIFEAPLTKIQNTFLTFGIHERIFGLGSIHFATAGTSRTEASWVNINHPLEVHEIVRETIRKSQNRTQPSNSL